MTDLLFACCFCGKPVKEPQQPKPVVLNWGDGEDEWQQWWCHLECFVDAIHERARSFGWEDGE